MNQREPTDTQARDRYGGEPERTLAAQARAYREKLGMTQAEVARQMSDRGAVMHQTTIAKIEAGQRPVRVNEAVLLAGILHATLADLLTAPGQPEKRGAAARDAERELLGQLLLAERRLEEHRAVRASAENAVAEAVRVVEAFRLRYEEALYRAEALAAAEDEGNRT
jgi:transcriptional regulator with XRE-family HTH domain